MRKLGFAKCMATAAFALLGSAVQAEPLIVTTNLTPGHWASTQGAEPWMKCVKETTKGGVDFKYFPSGQLANFFQSLNAVNKGLAQISYIVVPAQSDKLPLAGITLLPGLGSNVVHLTAATRAVLDGNGPIAREYAQNRIVPLMINIFPPYQMMSRKEPFDTLQSLQGRRISTGGGTLMVTLASTGATAVESAAADVYMGLQQGTVDGTMLSMASVKPYNLQEVIKSTSGNGNFGVANGIWSIDSGVWAKLPNDHKAALRECGLKVEKELAKWIDNSMDQVKKELKAGGVKVYDYSDTEIAKIEKKLEVARESYVNRLVKRGLPAKEAYEEYLAALRK
ncbi:TRAP transporter substrate-binding protein DctP [Noviherbaspirillum sedimenti]|uniref:Uncharacterized protein n=1 Tax=Noviherbaspirillum sedimenti TaxID=2320865 RepID=A0A3A3G480_9BURK|nr:TRAP transporter substrate-binding protein DctP [Noviherbaspirillum sedimenti]RJG03297.1 hypothetical protein D3878_18290 [Noviherbaspirillum sedimenti]